MNFTNKKLRVPMLGIGFAVASALAQGQQSTDATAEPVLEKITVTGSSIPRADTETPSPVQVITSEELKQSGYTTIAQVLGNITANGQGTLSQGFSGAFAAGAQAVSLRGLNSSATLVLIDGHRVAANPMFDDGQRSFVDIGSIPFDAIERVEVLKDGASAQYGSDAMAGVVNIIMKKNFVGTTANAEAGYATEGGGATHHYSLAHGFGDLDKDGYAAYGIIEYHHENPITNASRFNKGPWSSLNFTQYGGYNFTPGVINPTVALPTIPGSVYLYNPAGSLAPSAANTQFISGSCASWSQLSSGGCAYAPTGAIQPKTENINYLLSLTKKLSGDWQLASKASLFTSSVAVQQGGQGVPPPFPIFLNPAVGANGANPFVVNYPVLAQSPVTVPAGYPGNHLGAPAYVIGYDPNGPVVESLIQTKNYRLAFDLTGTLGAWNTGTAVTLSRINQANHANGTRNGEAMDLALNRAIDPYSITGGNSLTDIAAIYPANTADMESELGSLEVHASRSLANLEGGELDLSIGGSYLFTKTDAPAPALYAAGDIASNTLLQFVNGEQSDAALFAEVVAPITKQLELDAHARYDRFGLSGQSSALTPSLGFKWNATSTTAFRGTLATGFRAPNVAETGKSGLIFAGGSDTLLCPHPSTPAPGTPVASCGATPVFQTGYGGHLDPEKSVSATLGVILEPIKGWSSTLDIYDIKINHQIYTPPPSVASTPVRSQIPITGLCYEANGTAPCTTPGGANGILLYEQAPYVNTNDTEARGFELETHYKWHLADASTLYASLDWSHTLSYILKVGGTGYELAGTHGPELIGGDTANPKDRVQVTLTYDIGPWDITAVENYISGYDNRDPSYVGTLASPLANTCDNNLNVYGGIQYGQYGGGIASYPAAFCHTSSFYTTDVTVRYKVTKELNLHFAANNLLNKQPPLDAATYGGYPYLYNPSLHFAGAIGRFLQAGVTYSF